MKADRRYVFTSRVSLLFFLGPSSYIAGEPAAWTMIGSSFPLTFGNDNGAEPVKRMIKKVSWSFFAQLQASMPAKSIFLLGWWFPTLALFVVCYITAKVLREYCRVAAMSKSAQQVRCFALDQGYETTWGPQLCLSQASCMCYQYAMSLYGKRLTRKSKK